MLFINASVKIDFGDEVVSGFMLWGVLTDCLESHGMADRAPPVSIIGRGAGRDAPKRNETMAGDREAVLDTKSARSSGMQSFPLTVDKFMDHAAKWFGAREIVTANGGRITYAGLRTRSNRLTSALVGQLGLNLGDRIGTLAWNTQHHLEMYYAAMGGGLVCHTLNPRLTPAHLAAMIAEAEEKVLAVAVDLLPLLKQVLALCPAVEHVVLMDGAGERNAIDGVTVWDHEELLEQHGAPSQWGAFDENAAAGLCYTSGTTGKPKGVLYTHRSNYLHTLRALQADALAPTADDAILVAVPMFHANGWGLPFAAPAVGAKLVLPGRNLDGASLVKLLIEEEVTLAAGVQTVWLSVVQHLEETGQKTPHLRRVLIGGSKCPESLIRRLEAGFGADIQTSWGMTELSPVGTISPPTSSGVVPGASGRPAMGLDLKLTDLSGQMLDEQRGRVGHLWVKGASVVDRYYRDMSDVLDDEGYFDTGDLAKIDEEGNLTICGRSKDLIKSGGEWINPAEIEEIVGALPEVAQVAVIGRSDDKWGERPVLIVETHAGAALDQGMVLDSLKDRIAQWWLPDAVVHVESLPLAATGKIDKLRLREDYEAGSMSGMGESS